MHKVPDKRLPTSHPSRNHRIHRVISRARKLCTRREHGQATQQRQT